MSAVVQRGEEVADLAMKKVNGSWSWQVSRGRKQRKEWWWVVVVVVRGGNIMKGIED